MVPTGSSLGLGDTIQDTGVLYGIDTERYTYCMVPTLPSQRWQATLPGDGPPPPPRHAAPTGTVLGPRTHTAAPTARGWRTPTARPVGGQSGEGQRLTSDAPHNGGRHPPR